MGVFWDTRHLKWVSHYIDLYQSLTMSSFVIVLCGVDGSGKTTLYNAMSERGISVTCRDTDGPASIVDSMTLLFPFSKERAALRETLPTDGVRYVVLTAGLRTLSERVSARGSRDLWETNRALTYYDAAFREIAYECGWPVIATDIDDVDSTIGRIMAAVGADYAQYQSLALLTMDVEQLARIDDVTAPVSDMSDLTRDLVSRVGECPRVLAAVRDGHTRAWLAERVAAGEDCGFSHYPRLVLACEGESKRIYRIVTDPRGGAGAAFAGMCVIVLKNTIYSHSRQSTGEIDGLGRVRAVGSRINVEIMRREGLLHCYSAIGSAGVIVSRWLPPDEILPIEYVYKLACLGTDKHAYYGMTADRRVCAADGSYVGGGYVRFDMRNPNHTCGGVAVTDSPAYYAIEAACGKEEFFKAVLSGLPPWGDRTLPEPLAAKLTDIAADRIEVSRLFETLQWYYGKIGVRMLDTCFMKTRGHMFWSEINPDCMRIVRVDTADDLSKDIWRAGGSGAKDRIVEKWNLFNELMGGWLAANPFHTGPMQDWPVFAAPMRNPPPALVGDGEPRARRVMVTMDLYDGQPVLVKNGLVKETHSNGSVDEAMRKIGIFPDILVVDLNGALGEDETISRTVAAGLAKRYYVHFGGGLRNMDDVRAMLASSVRRVTVASRMELVSEIPRDRLVVELSVNERGLVMVDGRKTTTDVSFAERVKDLADMGVEAISITFHATEGCLRGIPRRQLAAMILSVPPSVKKIMVAGGITSVDDLHYCWSIDRVIPQLGSALWKELLTPGDIYAEMMRDDDGCVKTVVQDTAGRVLGVINLNAEAVRLTANSRTLWRWSKRHGALMQKGASSGRIMSVEKMALDCDGDALLVTVGGGADRPTFCHTGNDSCFSQQTVAKASLSAIAMHLEERRAADLPGSYSSKMMKQPAFALAKMFEELQEIVSASSDTLMSECSDMLIHMLMFMSGRGVTLEDILNELNARRYAIRAPPAAKVSSTTVTLLVTANKYAGLTDSFLERHAGIRVLREGGRSLKIGAEVIDPVLCERIFGTTTVRIMGCRPKDMAATIARGLANGAITYNTVADNQPPVMHAVVSEPVDALRLCLIKRKDAVVTFGGGRKIMIAAEHPVQVSDYLRDRGIDDGQFKIQPVLGSSESFLVNNVDYDLCDAVVETGKTLDENDLEVYETVIDHGRVTIGIYLPK